MEQSPWGSVRWLASVPILLMLTSSAEGLDIKFSGLFQCFGVKVDHSRDWESCNKLNATTKCREAGCGSKPGWVRLMMDCQGTERSLTECPQNPGNCTVVATITCSDPLLMIVLPAATGGVLLVLLVACVAFWRRRRAKQYALKSQIQYPPPEDHHSDDYERVDDENVEREEAEEEEMEMDEEPDYINVASVDNVQFVEIYGDYGSDGESYENVIPPDEHEQFVEIYGEEDFVYQNFDSM